MALSAVDVEERHSVNHLSIIDLEYTVLEDTQTQVIEASFSIKGQATVIMEYDKTTPTPAHCIADFSLIPVGTALKAATRLATYICASRLVRKMYRSPKRSLR